MSKAVTYAEAGVNIERSDRAKQRIRLLAKKTLSSQVLSEIGGFGALYALDKRRWRSPVLVSSTDGAGTKLKIAFATGRHRGVASDLVNHCVNDIAVQGAVPLFFLDYFACGRLQPEVLEQVVEGLADACRANGCSLVGGETAEMPGFYPDGEYDLAGFIVGAAERARLLDGSRIRAGDLLLGLPSAGLHTNGYSLARKLLLEQAGYGLDERIPRLGCTVAQELLKPHVSYLKPIRNLAEAGVLKGAAHITGGGIPGNLSRILPKNLNARVDVSTWTPLPVFDLLREIGNIPDDDLWQSFNMGIGMILVISPRDLKKAVRLLAKSKQSYFEIGTIAKGKGRVGLS